MKTNLKTFPTLNAEEMLQWKEAFEAELPKIAKKRGQLWLERNLKNSDDFFVSLKEILGDESEKET